ncbi:tyrosine-type recombinase/integrase [Sphingobium sp. MK2]|uniref:tyrosine-type recombinase/integrase n=1 Tax=Sphingobium sp. MK2 TaxID=3116540 RepID=UPI0032E358CC
MEFQPYRQWQVFDDAGRRKYANQRERRRLLIAADRCRPDIRALVLFLVFSGCRISEALALRVEHFDEEANTVTIRTLKRRRLSFRCVPIPPDLCRMVLALPTPSGSRIWRMHRVTAWRHVKALFDEEQVTGPMACCRGLRHGFGIRAAVNSVPPNIIQKWMGHALLSTTV